MKRFGTSLDDQGGHS
jgi:hypothetical protein